MTNLDSILKSRNIALPTKVRLVKAMVFPVVMYGYESWTVKKVKSLTVSIVSPSICHKVMKLKDTYSLDGKLSPT